ncbi:lengsin [Tachysurus ichikawai]
MDSDQIDGSNMSHSKKKVVRVSGKHVDSSEWDRKRIDLPIVLTNLSAPSSTDSSKIISIGPHCCPKVSIESQPEVLHHTGELNREGQPENFPQEAAVSKQTVEELKSLLKERSMLNTREKDEDKFVGRHCHMPGQRIDCKPDDVPSKSFTTFKHTLGNNRIGKNSVSSGWDSGGSSNTGGHTTRPTSFKLPTGERTYLVNSGISKSDYTENPHTEHYGSQSFYSEVEHIKRQIDHGDIGFVRFEATDLHGVSRSKTVPASLFHEKVVYGVPMPRSYLELTLSPKENEVDHPTAASFNSDILLIPDLPTFQALPWAVQTARIICDPFTITGIPLRTSPRLITKLMLDQLQALGLSIHSSFIYECCIFRVPDMMDPKAIFIPASTLLSNHDMPFLQQLVRGMYHMGISVDSFASASGPGQIEICFKPKFGIEAADDAFSFRNGLKEMARKYNYIATFLTDDTIYNSACLALSLWDANGRRNLFHSGTGEISDIGKKWLGGLLHHSPALSCLMAPGLGCRTQLSKGNISKSMFYATCGCNDNSCTFNVKVHSGQEPHIENKLGSAMANPYIVLAATIAAGVDGIKSNLYAEQFLNRAPAQQKDFAIPVKLEDALVALEEDSVICGALGEPFVHYFIAMKHLEIETQESDTDRDKNLEYFI